MSEKLYTGREAAQRAYEHLRDHRGMPPAEAPQEEHDEVLRFFCDAFGVLGPPNYAERTWAAMADNPHATCDPLHPCNTACAAGVPR